MVHSSLINLQSTCVRSLPGAMLQAGPGGAHRPEASTSGNGITVREQAFRNKLGDRGYARFEALKKSERQRGQSTAV
jgi:hypothetical protein